MLSGADWEAPRSHLDLGVSLCAITHRKERPAGWEETASIAKLADACPLARAPHLLCTIDVFFNILVVTLWKVQLRCIVFVWSINLLTVNFKLHQDFPLFGVYFLNRVKVQPDENTLAFFDLWETLNSPVHSVWCLKMYGPVITRLFWAQHVLGVAASSSSGAEVVSFHSASSRCRMDRGAEDVVGA